MKTPKINDSTRHDWLLYAAVLITDAMAVVVGLGMGGAL